MARYIVPRTHGGRQSRSCGLAFVVTVARIAIALCRCCALWATRDPHWTGPTVVAHKHSQARTFHTRKCTNSEQIQILRNFRFRIVCPNLFAKQS